MTRDDTIRMARKAGAFPELSATPEKDVVFLERFAALVAAAERNKVAQWMIDHSFATGHGDTTEDLLEELDWQITESWSKVVMASVKAEREACARMAEAFHQHGYDFTGNLELHDAIRARGQA